MDTDLCGLQKPVLSNQILTFMTRLLFSAIQVHGAVATCGTDWQYWLQIIRNTNHFRIWRIICRMGTHQYSLRST